MAVTPACLDVSTVEALLTGALRSRELSRVEVHIDRCAGCQQLVSAGVRTASLRSPSTAVVPAAPPTFDHGATVAGRYRIARFLARGGMGEVYAAHDLLLSEDIALKVVLCRQDDEAALTRLKAEVNLARCVTSPHVCRIFDLGVHRREGEPDVLFLTMQLLVGETLRQRLRRSGRLPSEAIPLLALDMAAALAAAHQRGIVHRDFKPDNVMLVPDERHRERAIVMDFGLAQAIAGAAFEADQPGRAVAGTIGYMAPEQIVGDEITAAADVFAFGVVMHEMLTGVGPGAARSPNGVDPAKDQAGDTWRIQRRWSRLIRRCLAADPTARFSDMGRVADVLQRSVVNRRSPSWRVALSLLAAAGAATMLATLSTTGANGGRRDPLPAWLPAPVLSVASTVRRQPTTAAEGRPDAVERPSVTPVTRKSRRVLRGGPRPSPTAPAPTSAPPVAGTAAPAAPDPSRHGDDDLIDPFEDPP